MMTYDELMKRDDYHWCGYIKTELDNADDKIDALMTVGITDVIASEFFLKYYILLYFEYKDNNNILAEAMEKIIFGGKVLLKRHTFPFLWLSDRSKKNVISAVEEKYLNHIKNHLKSTKDQMIDFIDSPPKTKRYKKNFMKALKLKGEENLRIIFKEVRGKYGIIVGVNDKTTDNEVKSNVSKLESLYELCEKAAEVDLNSLESIDGWLGFAVVEGYNKPPYFEEFKFHENDLLECLDSE